MAVWPGLGMNYGHQFPHSPYDAAQVAGDLAFLKSVGVSKLRIAYPVFDDASGTLQALQALVQTALAQGFYVVWGVVSGNAVGSARWSQFKNFVTGSLVPWAQSMANPNLELARGNEEELHCDGTTLTPATVIADMAALDTSGYTHGPVSYQAPITFLTNWAGHGLGSLDRIGFNAYSLGPKGMAAHAGNVMAAFPATGYLSEWGAPNGYNSYRSEHIFRALMQAQVAALKASGISDAYYFCYRDGSFGLPANEWAVRTTAGNFRLAAPALFGVRPWFAGVPNVPVARAAGPSRPSPLARGPQPGRPIF